MNAVNQEGVVDFSLYVGDKAPKESMGLHGRAGESIIFSGWGTGKSESTGSFFRARRSSRSFQPPRGHPCQMVGCA